MHRSSAPASDHPTRVDQVEGADRLRPLVVSPRGPVLPLLNRGLHESRYRQTVYPGDDPNRSIAEDYDLLYDETLKTETVPGLAEWTDALLRRLAADPANGLSSADVTRVAPEAFPRAVQTLPSMVKLPPFPPPGGSGPPPPAGSHTPSPGPSPPPALPTAGWERVGRALTVHLARSGEYTYTLDLRRQDTNIDPVMDFLVNVKAGHCRALRLGPGADAALAGRPVACGGGVPGCAGALGRRRLRHPAESGSCLGGNPGPSPRAAAGAPREAPRSQRWEWVTLDPTPASDLPPPAPYTLWDWWQDGQRTGEELWGGLVVNYGADQQADLWASLQSPRALAALTAIGLGLPALAAVGGLTYLGFRRRRRAPARGRRLRRRPPSASPGCFPCWRAHGGPRPSTGQTPREVAAEARRVPAGAARGRGVRGTAGRHGGSLVSRSLRRPSLRRRRGRRG